MIIQLPAFAPVPQSLLANVNENIDVFTKKKEKALIAELLRPCTEKWAHKGYRFIGAEDLTETKRTTQLIAGVWYEIIFIRHYTNRDRLSPLYFSVLRTDIILRAMPDKTRTWFYYESDAQVKRKSKEIKDLKS